MTQQNKEITTVDVMAGVNLAGRVVVITGATSGLGLETARSMAAAGATVVLAGRNATKTDAAVRTIVEQVPGARLDTVELDLSSLSSVRVAANQVLARHPQVHVLINNAGVMFTPFERTAEGFELQLGTNHFGHFLFTALLVPALLAGAPARVVNLSSDGHRIAPVDFGDPNYQYKPYNKFEAYGQSKTANVLFTVELNRRLAAQGVTAYAVHPGVIVTDLARHMSREDLTEMKRMSGSAPMSYSSIPGGAATSVFAATDAGLAEHGGAYLAACALSLARAYATDLGNAARLWALSERLTGPQL